MKKKYNTPHRCHVVKTRMTEEEYADFTERLKHYDMSQAEFIRQATPYNALSVEVRAAISDLAALKFEVLRKVGDAVGNIQTYQL